MFGLKNIKWLGHSSFQISNNKVIYIDPWRLKVSLSADIVLVTHQHYDHCSVEDIEKIRREDTIVIAPEDCLRSLHGKIKVVKPGMSLTIDAVTVEVKAAYNIGKPFHPRANNWVGFIVSLDGVRIYHAGDTDVIPEMDQIRDIDFALLPIGGSYTMNVQEAASWVNRMKPKVAIPMHYGSVVGSAADAQKFKRLCSDAEVHILDQAN